MKKGILVAKRKKPNGIKFIFFKKSTKSEVGHPVLVYRQSKQHYRYLTFTHTPEDDKLDNYKELKHNIYLLETNKKSYFNIYPRTTIKGSFRKPDKKYRIHEDDLDLIKEYKK